jgi:hypothetical protein
LFGGWQIVDGFGDEGTGDEPTILTSSSPFVEWLGRQMLLNAHDFENADQLLELGGQGFVQALFQSWYQDSANGILDFCYNGHVSLSLSVCFGKTKFDKKG